MRFGLMPSYLGPMHDKDYALAYIKMAEEAGFDSVWAPEHVVIPAGYASRYPYAESGKMPLDDFPMPDPFSLLAFWAAATSSILLGTGVTILPQRNPVVLAKECATIDCLSGGRLRLGVGVGWNREEMEAIGVPWEKRGARTDEHIQAMRALWKEPEASYRGEFVSFEKAKMLPKPAAGSVPVVVGGHSDSAARRAGRLGDGYWPNSLGGLPRLKEQLAIARQAAEEAGRDWSKVELMTAGLPDPAYAEGLNELGFQRMILVSMATDLESHRAQLEQSAELRARLAT
jgi:probable F420-dependent oxidoreductase